MRIKYSSRILLFALIASTVLVILILSGCQPSSTTAGTTNTPLPTTAQDTAVPKKCDPLHITSGNSLTNVTLQDGSWILFAPNTEIDIIPGGYCPGSPDTWIQIRSGQIAIHSVSTDGRKITVISPENFTSVMTDTAVITYDSQNITFQMDCTAGTCSLGPDASKLTDLACGASAAIEQGGLFSGPFGVDPASLPQYGDWVLPKCQAAGVSTRTPVIPTPDMPATATAYCASIQSKFPLTPCPTINP